MRVFLAFAAAALCASVVVAYPQSQQSVDPAYLRQYYAHLAQANREGQEATPIYESGAQEQSQAYASPQIRQYQAAAPQQQQQYSQPQQQQAYKPKQQQAPRRPAYQSDNAQRLREEEEEESDLNASYQFGFDVKDDEFTNYQNRQESRDNGVIKGSYSVVDSDGFIRTVKYTADPKEGFKAEVVREPTDIVVKIPPPHQEQQRAEQQQQRHQNHQYPAAYKQQQASSQQAQRQPQYQYE